MTQAEKGRKRKRATEEQSMIATTEKMDWSCYEGLTLENPHQGQNGG